MNYTNTLNKHGLSRYIPEDVKAVVRKRSKFGCVFCRSLVYDYEHFSPDFVDAEEHHADGICLVCPGHHAEISRGRISKDSVQAAYLSVQSNEQLRPPFHRFQLAGTFNMTLGNAKFSCVPQGACLLSYDNEKILQVEYVADDIFGGARPSISGVLYDNAGLPIVSFNDNAIDLLVEDVDVNFIGAVLTIKRNVITVFQMTIVPPNGIKINHMNMMYKDLTCHMDENFGLTFPIFENIHRTCIVSGIEVKGADAALSYCSDKSKWGGVDLQLIGGEGIKLPMSGVTIARNAGYMLIPSIVIKSTL